MIKDLKKILFEKGELRKELIQVFQNRIWNNEKISYNEDTIELLRDLAYDLDFCESDEKIENEIGVVIEKIELLS